MNKYQCGQVRTGDQVKGVKVCVYCMLKNYTVNHGGNIYHFIYRCYIWFAV